MAEKVGEIYYEVGADIAPLLQGGKQAEKVLDDLDKAAQQSGKGLGTLDKNADAAGDSLNAMAGYSKSIDSSLNKLNTTVSGIAKAMLDARTSTSGAGSEFSRAESIIESLGNQLAILEEAEQESARSAAILAAQLRAGSAATDEEKKKIADLTGRLYDMKNSTEAGGKSTGAWKSRMQQAGYSRMSMALTALADGEWVNVGDMVQVPDTYDTNQQAGYIVSRNGNDFETSERINFSGSMFVIITDATGSTTARYAATRRSDTDFGFTAAIPDIELNIYDGFDVQSPSRYVIATTEELDATQWTITEKKPNSGGTISLNLAEYSDFIHP